MRKPFLLLLLILASFSYSDGIEDKAKNEAINIEKVEIEKENKVNEEIKKVETKKSEVKSYTYIENYVTENPNYTLDVKMKKHFNEELNYHIYIRQAVNLRKNPNIKDKVLKKLPIGYKIGTTGLVKAKDGSKWYEVTYNKEKYFIPSTAGIKRAFNWQRAVEKADKINMFISNALNSNKDIYYVDSYVSLNTGTEGKKDKFGNAANQSIKAYYNNNKDYINLPDRALFTIVGTDSKYISIKTMSYGDEIYKIPVAFKSRIKKSNIKSSVNKFIYIDRHSQTEVVIEKNKETGIFNVNTVGYVTTGINKGVGFVTPYGDFLVAYTKPVMAYASDTETEEILNSKGEVIGKRPIVIGDARNAIRFSGGGYIHGIPSTFEPKDNREKRKKITESKLGSIPLSHKCVRNDDEIIKYIYNWVNGGNKIQKNGFTYPAENVIVIVE